MCLLFLDRTFYGSGGIIFPFNIFFVAVLYVYFVNLIRINFFVSSLLCLRLFFFTTNFFFV